MLAFDRVYPEHSVPRGLLSLLGFWNKPSLHQNGLNKHWAPQMPTELLWMRAGPSWPVEWRGSRLLSKGSGCSYSLTTGRAWNSMTLFQFNRVSKSDQQSVENALELFISRLYYCRTVEFTSKIINTEGAGQSADRLLTLKMAQRWHQTT